MSKLAFVFPGQGAQFVGMGKDLYETSPAAKDIFCRAESIRAGTIAQCFESPIAELSQTINTQPCMFAVSLASAYAMVESGAQPEAVAGFSVGEIAALTFAGVMSFEDGFGVVIKRAQLMSAAALAKESENKKGTMAAVLRISAEACEKLCKQSGVFAVNYNCPMQTVVAGETENMADFATLVAEAGGRIMPLAVSGAFHSPHMDGAAEEFDAYLKTIQISAPKMPIYANISARPYRCENNSDHNKKLMSQQINNPVLWQKTIEHMVADGFTQFTEVQPGKVLTGLISKILAN